jgi:cysteine desulfurase
LVSIMAVNNEIGVIQPLAEIGAICRERGILFHSDAAQAIGKIPIDVHEAGLDLLSLSGHKLYGPKGVGALFVRRRPRVRLAALFSGGGQERGLRSGTLPTPLCVGLGVACQLAVREMPDEANRLAALRSRFLAILEARLGSVTINGDRSHRIAGNLNLAFAGLDAEHLIRHVRDEIAVSSGSACTSASVEPSHVLRALGMDNDVAVGSIRVGFGRFTTAQEVDVAADVLATAVQRLRAEGVFLARGSLPQQIGEGRN